MTLINHTYGFVFVHVPKNAGTSVAQYLSQLSTYRDQEIGGTALGEAAAPHYRERFSLHKHSTLAEIRDVISPDDLARYRTIAVVRDPADRVRSIFAFLRTWSKWTSLDPEYATYAADFPTIRRVRGPAGRLRSAYTDLVGWPSRRAAAKETAEAQTAVRGFEDVDAFIASDLFMMPGPDRLFLPQVDWLTLDGETVGVDQVVRFEHLESDLAGAISELGLPQERLTTTLARSNASRGKGAKPLRPESVARLGQRYERDYELLGSWN
jgi:hypothetical protein